MKRILFIIIILALTIPTIFAQVDRTKAPQPGPAPKIQIGEPTKFELPNGLKVFVVENHRLPRVAFSFSFIFDPPLETPNVGIGSMTSDLIGTGTKTRTKDQINDDIDFMGAELSASPNGLYASSLKKHMNKLLEIVSDVAQNSVFTKEELEKKRTQFLSGLAQQKDDPNSIASKVSSALIYGKNYPYGEFETEASVKSLTPEMCAEYYQTYFRPNIAYLSIVGDITPAEAKKVAEKYFSTWQKGVVKTPTYAKPQQPEATKVIVVDRKQSVQSVINICYPLDINLGNPDYIRSRVLNTVLGGGTFRLFNNLREKHGYTYGAYSNIGYNPLMGSFKAYANARNEVTDSAVYQFLYEMKRIRNEQVPATELSMVKNYLTGNFALSLESPQTIASFAINTERYKLPKDFYANYLKNIEAVTPQDIQAMAAKYILPEKSIILVVGKASDIADKLKQFSPTGKIEYYDNEANPYDPTQKSAAIPANMTAQTVLNKYIEASGGLTNINKIKTFTLKGKVLVQGMSLDLNMYYKIPGKFMMEMLMNGQTMQKQILNGDKGKSSGMGGQKELTGEELNKLKEQSDLFPEISYEKLNYKTELKGVEKIDGKDVYVLDITSPSNTLTTEYYSVETGLKLRSVSYVDTPNGKLSQTTDVLEYETVNSVKFPKKMKTVVGPQTMEINMETLEANTDIKDDIFN
jgi:Predicted Zn-dependent peptidases